MESNWKIDSSKPTKYYVIVGAEDKVAVMARNSKEAAVKVLADKILKGIRASQKSKSGSYSMMAPVDILVSTCGTMTPDEFETDYNNNIYKGMYNSLEELDKAWSVGHEKDEIFDASTLFEAVSERLQSSFEKDDSDIGSSDEDDCDEFED